MAYIYILLGVVFAPFWIVAGLIPGSPISFTGWLRDIVANLAAFPATIAMFLLGNVFIKAFGTNSDPTRFVPPLVGNPGDTNAIGALVGLGVILLTPNVVNILRSALKAPKLDVGSAVQAIGAGAGVLTSPTKPVFEGFRFLAGQKAAEKLPFIGHFIKR